MAPTTRGSTVPLAVAVALLAALPAPAWAQGAGPRALFPAPPPPRAEEPPPDPGDAAVPAPAIIPRVTATPLASPGLGARGLPGAEESLGGPLWEEAAPPDLAARLARLPARVDDPTLRRLQRDLLLAPGPVTGAGADAVRARVDRLLAMGEAAAAADLLAALPDAPAAAGLDPLRAQALLAADRVEAGCDLVDRAASAGDDPFWTRAQPVCAALRGDRARAELGLSLLTERGRPADPLLAALVLAQGGAQRTPLREPPPADPLLLPLLRRAPLQPDPKALANAPAPVRQAVADNPDVPAGLAPPAAEPPPAPSLPGLAGQPVADWSEALRAVPEPARARWLAALDGLGAAPPADALAAFPPSARAMGGGLADLVAWRDLEEASAGGGARGPALLAALALLDGRPAEASPLALRAALAALRRLGLGSDARAVAAAGLAPARPG